MPVPREEAKTWQDKGQAAWSEIEKLADGKLEDKDLVATESGRSVRITYWEGSGASHHERLVLSIRIGLRGVSSMILERTNGQVTMQTLSMHCVGSDELAVSRGLYLHRDDAIMVQYAVDPDRQLHYSGTTGGGWLRHSQIQQQRQDLAALGMPVGLPEGALDLPVDFDATVSQFFAQAQGYLADPTSFAEGTIPLPLVFVG